MKVVFVTGPTASGKSGKSLQMARVIPRSAIVNCDSVQAHAGLRIGSAGPTDDELQSVPHFLYHYVPLGETLTAGKFRTDFFEQLKKLEKVFDVVWVVGGSGFYIQALLKGLFETSAADPAIKEKWEKLVSTPEGMKQAHAKLKEFDPAAAERIHENDAYRLARALELWETKGQKTTDLHADAKAREIRFPYPFQQIILDPPKHELEIQIRKRAEEMIDQGLLQETKGLLDQGLKGWPPLSSVGYKEAVLAIESPVPVPKATLIEEISIKTRQLVKKQKTWFRSQQAWEDRILRLEHWPENEVVPRSIQAFLDQQG